MKDLQLMCKCAKKVLALVRIGYNYIYLLTIIVKTDACRPNPCYRSVLCLNDPESLHTFKCGPCPTGMMGNGTHCEFVDEVSLSHFLLLCMLFKLLVCSPLVRTS